MFYRDGDIILKAVGIVVGFIIGTSIIIYASLLVKEVSGGRLYLKGIIFIAVPILSGLVGRSVVPAIYNAISRNLPPMRVYVIRFAGVFAVWSSAILLSIVLFDPFPYYGWLENVIIWWLVPPTFLAVSAATIMATWRRP